jgi:hypothetical protein
MKTRFAFLFLVVMLLTAGAVAREEWRIQQNPQYGFSFSYPQGVFTPLQSDGPSLHRFISSAGNAKLVVAAWETNGRTPEEFKRWMLADSAGYDITYEPRGRSWFVVSGYRGDRIYYEKVAFSCAGRVANVLAITYPVGKRDLFDPLVERMEDDFKPGPSCPS